MHDGPQNFPSPHFYKFAAHSLLKKKYDRLLYVDCDLIIREDCPNLFDLYGPDDFAIFNEGKYVPRAMALHEAQKKFGEFPKDSWDKISYYNTGVWLCGKNNRFLFSDPMKEWKQMIYGFGEQSFLNWRIVKNQIPVKELSWKFNRMSCMNMHLGLTRLAAHIVHYAGVYDTPKLSEIVKRDLAQWEMDKESGYIYHPTYYISCTGGLGDQVCAEPSIRKLRKIEPEAEIIVFAAYPQLFKHLNVYASDKLPEMVRPAIFEVETHPNRLSQTRRFLSHFFSHGVDYASMHVLKRILPPEEKQIMLSIPAEHDRPIVDADLLIHPGTGWPIKTFPREYWEKIIHVLAKDMKVAVVGKNLNADHGVVALDPGPDAIDLRNKLDFFDFLAMIKYSWGVLTNDSSPTHLAGAFDNWIFLIPTCKHPDYLLPYRHGLQSYKTGVFCQKLLEQENEFHPNDMEWSTTTWKGNIYDYLPPEQEVIDSIKKEFFSRKRSSIEPLMVKPITSLNKKREENVNDCSV
jgi:ADP-heptose:LPS heptosyltransferase